LYFIEMIEDIIKDYSLYEIRWKKIKVTLFWKKPNILRNSVTSDDSGSDFNLELDCYNARLKIACEYNGIQHYKFTPYFHKNKDAFQNQKYRDYMKRDLCMKNNITLIEVPYTVKLENIENFIINKLLQSGYKI
jgi:hypothetical protein